MTYAEIEGPDHAWVMSPDPDDVHDEPLELSPRRWRAVVFDLDGVLTRTAAAHAAAWKQAFDEFLDQRGDRAGEDHSPFDADDEYRRYVDGRPRYDGVQTFLRVRGIDLPRGEPDDPTDRATVCGVGNRKNRIFRETLHRDGVEVLPGAVALIDALRHAGVGVAVMTSSKNADTVLAAAGLDDAFDVKIDGVDAEVRGLAGKPEPDVYQAAAAALGEDPVDCVVFEDATVGVQAGAAGGFGLVVGVDREHRATALRDAGADRVVTGLHAVRVGDGEAALVPSALEALDDVLAELDGGGAPGIFLDYDGTLTPIVARPEDATLDDAMRVVLERLAARCVVAVVSGRDLPDVRRLVGIESIHYAGSHGFEIDGPRVHAEHGREFLEDLDHAEHELARALEAIEGARVERKHFAVAVHFRNVERAQVDTVRDAVDRVHARRPDRLRRTGGKEILELRPALDWDKGRALRWSAAELGVDVEEAPTLYVGDDTTDEDAFAVLRDHGVGVLVSDEPRRTKAHYRLRDVDEVRRFLEDLAAWREAAGS